MAIEQSDDLVNGGTLTPAFLENGTSDPRKFSRHSIVDRMAKRLANLKKIEFYNFENPRWEAKIDLGNPGPQTTWGMAGKNLIQ
jgi:hypothetical protein